MLAFRSILHPTDFSEHSEYAFEVACALARDYGARLILTHVTTPADVARRGDLQEWLADRRHELHEALRRMRPRDDSVPVERHVSEGDPAEEILRSAHFARASLIVMGSHGRTGLARLLTGSVAEKVLRGAPCPVLAVKAPFASQESADRPWCIDEFASRS